MADALRRQLEETNAARQRLAADEARLRREEELANSTGTDKGQRLKEATRMVDLASSDFEKERSQLEGTLEAAGTAVRFLQAQEDAQTKQLPNGRADLEGALTQLSPERLNEAERNTVASFLEAGSDDQTKSQELLQTLLNFQARLEGDRNEAESEHSAMIKQLHEFADRLSASILEAAVRQATVKTEAAQRKRERARLDGKASDLTLVLRAVGASAGASKTVCLDMREQKEQLRLLVRGESRTAKELVRALPSDGREWSGIDGSTPTGAPAEVDMETGFLRSSPVAFLQLNGVQQVEDHIGSALKELDALARKFQDDSTLYLSAASNLSSLEQELKAASDIGAHTENKSSTVAVGTSSTGSKSSEAQSALQDIQQFALDSDDSSVGDDIATTDASVDGEDTSSAGTAVDSAIQETYTSLLKQIMTKESVNENKRAWCTTVMKSASADGAAIARSRAQASAKLHIAQRAIVDYEQSSKYDLEQHGLIKAQQQHFESISAEADRLRNRFTTFIIEQTKQLNFLIQASTSQDQRSSQIARQLVRVFERHQQKLQAAARRAPQLRNAITSADTVLLRLLSEDARHAGHRLLRLKSEATLLASLSSKLPDKQSVTSSALEPEDVAMTALAALCSKQSAESASLSERTSELREEERALRGALRGYSPRGS
jgi:hypothetical protein